MTDSPDIALFNVYGLEQQQVATSGTQVLYYDNV